MGSSHDLEKNSDQEFGSARTLRTSRRGPAPFLHHSVALNRFRRSIFWRTTVSKVLVSLSFVLVLWRLYVWGTAQYNLPPLYPEVSAREKRLPQHNKTLPFPEGKNGRFLRFGNQLWGVGFNNQLQEVLINAHVAHLSHRAYVFQPYRWSIDKSSYVPIEHNSHLSSSSYTVRPARIPLSAFIEGPTTGHGAVPPLSSGSSSSPYRSNTTMYPRAVAEWYWERVCPQKRQVHIDTALVNEQMGLDMGSASGEEIVRKWGQYLDRLDASCVNIDWGTPRIIDYDLVGSNRLPSLWASISTSPVLTSFDWSSIVHSGVLANMHLFHPTGSSRSFNPVPKAAPSGKGYYEGLVALHVRRGDYKTHCEWIAPWGEFNGWSQLPSFPRDDLWSPPWSTPTEPGEARRQYAFDRCWIEIPAIVARLARIRAESGRVGEGEGGLDRVFVSTNADEAWLEELKEALRPDGWRVITSRDLELDWRQRGVDVAIDMEIASRAEIFVGNGYSSMTSNIIQLRLIRGVPVQNTRLW